MYLRFTTKTIDEVSHKPSGVFVEAYRLLDSGDLNSDEWKELRDILDWFNINLPHPPKKFTASRAIFWFNSNAKESIRRIWDLVHLLQAHGHHVNVFKCRRLANITYSDQFQVAAYPSDLDGKITQQ
jgi:hypothetical protein